MVEPQPSQHVMVFENQRGVRQCVLHMEGHAMEEPHRITVGYSCLRSPQLETAIMKALGFPFEHNRAIRDLYIDVQFENIEQGFIPFFTKEKILPQELRSLPYDVNSVMHFGERDYSKNGHRSFIFKNKQTQQSRIGLSKTDLRKIEIIYGPECQKRDRQAKIDICKKYPSVRRKRELKIDLDIVQNLRINRAISPPPENNLTDDITDNIKDLNIDEEVQDLIEQVHKITAAALENERVNICNNTNITTRKSDTNVSETQHISNDKSVVTNDIIKIIEVVIHYVKAVVNNAKANLTVFCDATNSLELFQRSKYCGWGSNNRCPKSYKSTKSGLVQHSTKHRPFIRQSTKHGGNGKNVKYDHWLRSDNSTQEAINATRRKRDVEKLKYKDDATNIKFKKQNLRINRDISPPPENNLTDETTDNIKELNFDEEVQDLIEQVHKITAAALENERVNICNNTNITTRKSDTNVSETQHISNDKSDVSYDIIKIIEVVIHHVKAVVNNAKANLTVFCDTTNSLELFQRSKYCGWGSNNRCPKSYKSTKSGLVQHSTKHRPFIRQSTKNKGNGKNVKYVHWLRSDNSTQEAINTTRRKRDVEKRNYKDDIINIKFKIHDSFGNIVDYSSRRKRDTKISNETELNNVSIETIDSFTPIGNNSKESITAMDKERKRKAETPKLTDLTVNNTEKINAAKIRNKREDDTTILSDNANNVLEKTNGSLVTNTNNAFTESFVETDKTVEHVNVNGSKDALRMVTRVYTDKKVDFAPVRRSNRDGREFSSRNRESDNEEQRDDSSSSESDKRKRTTRSKKEKRERDDSRERERERTRERDRHRVVTEDRPQNRRPKGKGGRQRRLLPEIVPLTKGNKEFYAERIWPDGVVRYVVAQDSTYNLQSIRARLAEVNDILKKKTCVRINEVSEKEGERYNDYLVIDTSADYVTGRVGGRQNFGSIELFEGGQHRQHAAMMVMAMLGFYFEPSRHDRDQFVRVHNRHIRPDKLHHFEKIRPEATLNLPYDYTSATHPAWQFWRRVGHTGISSVATYKDQDPDGSIMKSLGQNEKLLSDVDIIKINSVYGVHCFQKQARIKKAKSRGN
ncbi:uncharacterized protein PF3D7_1120600-like [Maniola hyperantus]|uniref:uncharacterized protein PF3D7_1120600-like n=1 Tax=Aphantopus hyperantus TaxID=2795564 RepID=UPI00374820A6